MRRFVFGLAILGCAAFAPLAARGDDQQIAQAVMQKLAKEKFDVVFTDFNMPEMLGDELAKRIRGQYPHQVIAMISAYSNLITPHHKKEIPVDFFISKPFQLQNILKALESAYEINEVNRRRAEPVLPTPSTAS